MKKFKFDKKTLEAILLSLPSYEATSSANDEFDRGFNEGMKFYSCKIYRHLNGLYGEAIKNEKEKNY